MVTAQAFDHNISASGAVSGRQLWSDRRRSVQTGAEEKSFYHICYSQTSRQAALPLHEYITLCLLTY